MEPDNILVAEAAELQEKAQVDHVARTKWEMKTRSVTGVTPKDIYGLLLFAKKKHADSINAIIGHFSPLLAEHVSAYLANRPEVQSNAESVHQVLNESYLAVLDAIEHFDMTLSAERNIDFSQYVEACVQTRMVCLAKNEQYCATK